MSIEALVEQFHGATFIPMYYDSITTKTSYSTSPLPEAIISYYLSQIDHQRLTIINDLFLGAMITTPDKEVVIIGPIATSHVSLVDLQIFLSKLQQLSSTTLYELERYVHSNPMISVTQFKNAITIFYQLLYQQAPDFPQLERLIEQQKRLIQQKNAEQVYHAKEAAFLHNTYQFEKELYGLVTKGNPVAISQLLKRAPNLERGRIGNTSLRQAQNIFIAGITQITRASIAGGLDIETAYQLSDTYIQESERMTNTLQIEELSVTALFDFAQRVEKGTLPQNLKDVVHQAIYFIRNHTNQSLQIQDVANAVHMSKSHLSRLFKSEMNMTINDYIVHTKLEDACMLLKNTDKSLSDIASYLCFSSQPYFQNVFKRHYHMTPRQYRQAQQAHRNQS